MYRITAEYMQSNSLSIPVKICDDTNKTIEALALIDSGAGEKFILLTKPMFESLG